jgi:hypothetical protein
MDKDCLQPITNSDRRAAIAKPAAVWGGGNRTCIRKSYAGSSSNQYVAMCLSSILSATASL